MKKTIFVILIVAILATVLVACGEKNGSNDIYKNLNSMMNEDYSVIKLEVETTDQGITLVNKYTATTANERTSIRYTIQTLAEIKQNPDGSYDVPDELIVTETGSATVVDGKITITNGNEENIPVDALQNINIKFDKSYFMSTIHSENDGVKTITGTVIQDHIKDFTGNQNFAGKNMTFTVTCGEKLQSLVINYTMNSGATVKVTYTFS